MRTALYCLLAVSSLAMAQDDAWSLAWSSVGEAAGDAMPLGRGQPAAFAWAGTSMASISAVPDLYGLPGLRWVGIGGMLARDGAGLGSSLTTLEAGTTRRLGVRLNAGFVLVEAISAGLGLQLARWSFDRYGSTHEAELTIGAQNRSERLTTGVALTVSAQEYRPISAEDLRIALGSAARLSDGLTVVVEAVDAGALEIRMGARAMIIDELAVILSWSDGAEILGAGLDLTLDEWRAIAGGRWHPLLGWSHGIDLHFTWK